MTKILYFAYGSNMLTAWLRSRCKSARARGVASVAGYRLAFSKRSKDGSGKAMLVSSDDPAARVYGVLYEIANDEILELDRAEGRGKGYERLEDFEVRADGNGVRVMTYMTDNTAFDAALKPYDWYLALAVKGAEENGLPSHYIATMRATGSISDPDLDRLTHQRALAILGRPEKRS
jgi:gamma-glutamylcyclotransferase (GGCT)/AIG2-like uncharacterized protein YtfP